MEPENPDNKYLQLAEKWMNGTITPEEESVFAQWYNEQQNKEIIIPESFVSGEGAHRQRIWERIQHFKAASEPMRATGPAGTPKFARTPEPTGTGTLTSMRAWTPRVAASVLLVLVSAASIWWFYSRRQVRQPIAGTLVVDTLAIHPVENRARLTLGNGAVVDLDSVQEGLINGDDKTRIDKQKAQLVYRTAAGSASVAPGQSSNNAPGGKTVLPSVVYNTLTTPRGGMYSVVLSDGTRVWLNASSSLRYPTAFTGRTREVSLTGEAYFEVAQKSSQPFTVVVNGMDVNVLGTHFDVMAYDDESAVATTLLEGSVKVDFKGRSIALAPGQQSLLIKDKEELRVRDVDVDAAVAWKNGIFQFRSEDIKSVMRKVARWYDVDIRYDGEISDHFSGAVRRDADVSSLLRTMELTHEVQFHIEGRTITVSP